MKEMNYRLLGRSGLRVSELCLGTMTFGEDWGWGSAREEARRMYETYRSAGGNFIDTANFYTQGTSERFVGEFVAGHREEVVIATKYTNSAPGLGANAGGNQRKTMVQAVEASLKRLNTDYIDLYWLHIWDGLTPVEEVMRAFDDLVRAGKVLHIGVSNTPAWVVSKANTLAELRGWTRYNALQIEYNLLERTVEQELLPMACDQQLAVVAWSPLAFGLLTGKYLPEHGTGATDGRMNDAWVSSFKQPGDSQLRTVREVVAIGRELGVSPARVALAWLRQRPIPVIPIVGARRHSQLEDNLACLEVVLTSEQVVRLDQVSAAPLIFPHSFRANDSVRAISSGGMAERIRG